MEGSKKFIFLELTRFGDGEDFDDILNFVLSNQPKLNNDNFEASLIGDGGEEVTGGMKETVNNEVEQSKNERRRGRPCSGPPSKTVLKQRRYVGYSISHPFSHLSILWEFENKLNFEDPLPYKECSFRNEIVSTE